MKILKADFSDDFKCIADKCTYSCCFDWNIVIDRETGCKYMAMEDGIKNCLEDVGDGLYKIILGDDGGCPMLDENGLCCLVKTYGDEMLSTTCASFPRIVTKRADTVEFALSNTCPAVLMHLKKHPSPLTFIMDEPDSVDYEYENNNISSLEARDYIIDLLQIADLPLWTRLYMIYSFANQLDKGKLSRQEIFDNFNSAEKLLEMYNGLKEISYEMNMKLSSIFSLFCSANAEASNYLGCKRYVQPVREFVKGSSLDSLTEGWKEFETIWEANSEFLENVCVNNMFLNGINDFGEDKNEENLSTNVRILLTEIILIHFTSCMYWLSRGKQLDEIELIEIICYYARIFDHNRALVYAFLKSLAEDEWFHAGGLFIMLR